MRLSTAQKLSLCTSVYRIEASVLCEVASLLCQEKQRRFYLNFVRKSSRSSKNSDKKKDKLRILHQKQRVSFNNFTCVLSSQV